jgi:hypothetical protein
MSRLIEDELQLMVMTARKERDEARALLREWLALHAARHTVEGLAAVCPICERTRRLLPAAEPRRAGGQASQRSPLQQLADRIHAHLQRFEADPVINRYGKGATPAQQALHPYYHAVCGYGGGSKIFISYVSYQGNSFLTWVEAAQYLEKLDAGFVGRHYEALRKP